METDHDWTITYDEYSRAYVHMKTGNIYCLEQSLAGELIIYPGNGNQLGLSRLGAGEGKAVVVSQHPIGVVA